MPPEPASYAGWPQPARLLLALATSLLTHILALVMPQLPTAVATSKPPPMQIELRTLPPVAAPVATPELQLPPETVAEPSPPPGNPKKKNPQATGPKTWTQSVREQLAAQQKAGQFYPAAAIAQGLEGEVLVYFVLGSAGDIVAARVEDSSGHPLLDEAAVQAVRRLRGLPGDAPQEALLPVRFRLR